MSRMDSLFLGISSTGRRHIVILGEVNFFLGILWKLKNIVTHGGNQPDRGRRWTERRRERERERDRERHPPGASASLHSQTFCSALPLPEETLCEATAAHGLSESSKPCSLKANSSRVIFQAF